MLEKDAEKILNDWCIDDRKVFKYNSINRSGSNYIIIIKKKDNLYTIDKEKSSCIIGPFEKVEIKEMLKMEELVAGEYYLGTHRDYRRDRIGNCECGLGDPKYGDKHSTWCPLYTPPVPN